MKFPPFLTKLGFTEREFHPIDEIIEARVEEACQRIAQSPFDLNTTYVGHSGGKDSVVVHFLAKKVRCFDVVHTPKNEGPNAVHPLTRDFLYDLPDIIRYVPSRLHATLGYTTQIDGTRIAEATRQDGRSTHFVRDGKEYPRTELTQYVPNSLFGLNFIYPIYDWSDLEVWTAIFHFAIPFSKEYEL